MYWDDQAIIMALEALKVFVHSLPEGSMFNICSFGCNFSYLFPDDIVKEYNEETMQQALEAIDTYASQNMGGTEIFEPLQDIFNKKSVTGMRR